MIARGDDAEEGSSVELVSFPFLSFRPFSISRYLLSFPFLLSYYFLLLDSYYQR